MVLETADKILLVNWSDVKTTWKFKWEANEHTYCRRRCVLRELNMPQVTVIEDNHHNVINAVFEGGLKTCCPRNLGDTKRNLENILKAQRKLYKISMEFQWMSDMKSLLYISCGVKQK